MKITYDKAFQLTFNRFTFLLPQKRAAIKRC
jgi:hypothetical protein